MSRDTLNESCPICLWSFNLLHIHILYYTRTRPFDLFLFILRAGTQTRTNFTVNECTKSSIMRQLFTLLKMCFSFSFDKYQIQGSLFNKSTYRRGLRHVCREIIILKKKAWVGNGGAGLSWWFKQPDFNKVNTFVYIVKIFR